MRTSAEHLAELQVNIVP